MSVRRTRMPAGATGAAGANGAAGTPAPSDGWTAAGETWTYASADDPTYTFTISGDVTTKYSPGMRIRVSQSTGGTKYFIVTNVDYSAPNTTMTIYGGTDYNLVNETISSPYWSVVKAPYGFPLDPSKWTVEVTDSSDRSQSSPVTDTWYNLGSITIAIPIGCWVVDYQVAFAWNASTNATRTAQCTLSTSNNSESDSGFTGANYGYTGDTDGMIQTISREKTVTLGSGTSYYLNARSRNGLNTLIFYGSYAFPTKIRAVCAYL